jgi:two-component system, OmpR family, sensor kinase
MASAPPAFAPPFWQRLHVRIGAVTLVVLVLMALALLALTRSHQARSNLEWTQRMNMGLASYIVQHQPRPLFTAQGTPDEPLLREMAMHVMMTNPALEVYLLDKAGRVVSHALDGAVLALTQVDLQPLQQLLANPQGVRLPLWGDDPRDPGRSNVFSVAALGDQGYLYVVLRGQAARGLAQDADRSSVLHNTAWAMMLAVAVAAAALILGMAALTRPLRRLTAQVQSFRDPGQHAPSSSVQGDEITLLTDAIATQQARIATQFEQLAHSDQLRRELVSNLSHDLHTPLASIQGYVERCLLRNHQLTPEEREAHLRVVLRHCTSLGKRIGDLFELSKLDAGRVQPKLEAFCLSELLHDVTQAYQLQAEQKKITLELTSACQSTALVRADIALIERVLQNLIDNALRYTPAGGTIHIDIQPQGAELVVSVCDTGIGIASEHLPHVFERYWQAQDTALARPGPSAGLGLAIVKRILELHGSVIRIRSELAGGTRCDFSLLRAA